MKINKKHIITIILMILTLILAVFFAVKVNAANTDTDVVADEKTMVRFITALAKGYDSITAGNIRNIANHYLANGVVTILTPSNNRITFTFNETGNSYDISANTGVAFDDIGGVNGYYTITYNANGGTGAPAVQTKIAGTAITLSTTEPTRTGYTFLGWSTNSSATTAEYASGGTFATDDNTTLYAVWRIATTYYTITYNANGGTGAPNSQTKTHGVDLTLTTTEPTRTGYTFLGWSTNLSAITAEYASGAQFTTDANTTLYAVWETVSTTVTVTLYPNGGIYASGRQYLQNSTTKGGSVTLPETVAIPKRTGYTFLGYSESATATTAQYTTGQTIQVTKDLVLYAVWQAN